MTTLNEPLAKQSKITIHDKEGKKFNVTFCEIPENEKLIINQNYFFVNDGNWNLQKYLGTETKAEKIYKVVECKPE